MKKLDLIWVKSFYIAEKYWGCHQMPVRSFFIKGYQLPICARCTGIIISYFLTIPILMLFNTYSIYLPVILIIPLIIDGLIQLRTKYESNNRRRLLTGLLFGVGQLLLIKFVLIKIF